MRREALRPSLRILMVLESNFSKRGGGGAESQLRTIARALRRVGHRVAVVTPCFADGPQAAAERCFGLPVARVKYPRIRLVGGAIMNARFAAFLVQHRRRYDAWHVHIGHHMGALACLLGDLLRVPVIVKISGWWELEAGLLGPKRSLFGRVAAGWLKRATAVQAISTRVAAELEKHGFAKERIVVLPNAVDVDRFGVRAGVRAAGEPFVAVYVGRLVPEKDLTTLVTGWARAFAGRDDVRLRLVGGGPLEGELRALAQTLGVAQQVELLGHRDDIAELLAEAHVGLLPSRIEGLSNTLLEYMASGLPPIASRISGSEDFVHDGENGWLHPVGDADAVARCLAEAAALPPARLGELGRNARATVAAEAALPRVVERLVELYQRRRP